MTTTRIARALMSEFVIEHRCGGEDATEKFIAQFLHQELFKRGKISNKLPHTVWAYYTNSGKTMVFTFDKEAAEGNADGFTWDNPRVRKVGVIMPDWE